MSTCASKIEVIKTINALRNEGKEEDALKLQRIFLRSIQKDQEMRKYSSLIQLDRAAKKVVKALSEPLLVEVSEG